MGRKLRSHVVPLCSNSNLLFATPVLSSFKPYLTNSVILMASDLRYKVLEVLLKDSHIKQSIFS